MSPAELGVGLVVTFVASIVAEILGAPDKWLAAIYVTVVVFVGMVFFFRDRWTHKGFWILIGATFLVHLLLIWLIFGVLLRQRGDVGLLVCLPPIFFECFLIYQAVKVFGRRGH